VAVAQISEEEVAKTLTLVVDVIVESSITDQRTDFLRVNFVED
jgi:hypothetical protein